MKRDRWLSGLFLAGMLCVMLGTFGAQVAQAQRPIPLEDLQCVKRSGRWGADKQDISVGRQIYTTVLYIDPDTTMTCRLPGGPATLRFEFAIPDTSNAPPARIDVYVDGNQVASRTGDRGKVHTMLVNVSNGKSLAVEVFCARATNCYKSYWFMKAQLEPGASSPGSK
ncbi:MAG: hypothetical protein JGK24_17630 [Microcoleus sp. PH2017_29_MFU_D_A]|uniref:hypothetical protein n=1 Tax=unclassified Microcoleus TaxID=2642155 RepID=UPI001DAE1114|nr:MULTISPECIES: hypothetical protein [unclassified Microcoleus]MCC3418046.1 hypothetical protein [Microcoleus sp. PH2017_07_MST_O_A]MCC3469442.1 hypothetical protein [Microcoleus sp. PH2017_06_SFM_O_A]TAE05997.1 MAG: hypothetical protein EAZ94_31340 [Oscillatoriales cyanobacterium]MCC3411407.1 hypothetical protein [Microcoleus sp. PH2017_02_FOX_O_A]MCC3422504.1 hypothetical protein [Microcoleus sp. PH2017_01_SCD_O_A]